MARSRPLLLLLLLAALAISATACGASVDSLNQKSEAGKEYSELAQWKAEMDKAGLDCTLIGEEDSMVSKKANYQILLGGKPQILTVDIFGGATAAEMVDFYSKEYLKTSKQLTGKSGQILVGPNWTVSSVEMGALQSVQAKMGGDIEVSQ